tara:strand:- start:4623 stop:6410 length:1788 start_codon:yes stop_codon:yes gene_type:complete
MPAPSKIQLGNLDYESIKSSLLDYLKEQDTLKDYDYSGSAVQVLLDILTYNTLYYGYYSNMVANEMFLDTAQREESLISLVKPLGYVVPGSRGARARVKLRYSGGANSNIPIYTRFSGNNENGTPYNFYTLLADSTNEDGEAILEIIEGKELIKQIPLSIDQTTQKGFISGLDTDISTIIVEVYNPKENDDGDVIGWEIWSRASNIQTGLDNSSTVYWLERSELGFFVVFGGNLFGSQIAMPVSQDTPIRLSYLKSNGDIGNGVGNFKVRSEELSGGATETLRLSSGGSASPDLEAIRFFAPKWFAAQERAVTVEDCRGLLAAEGFVSGSEDPYSKFNVWGGEEMNPPMYGRLFVSLNVDTGDEGGAIAASNAIRILEEKTCVTILPEYINPTEYEFVVRGILYYDPILTSLSPERLLSLANQKLFQLYPNRYNMNIQASDIAREMNKINSAFNVSSSDINFYVSKKVTVTNGKVSNQYFKNSIKPNTLTSSKFTPHPSLNIPEDRLVALRTMDSYDRKGRQFVEVYYDFNGLPGVSGKIGSIDNETGILSLKNNLTTEDFTIYAEPHGNSQSYKFKEEMIPSITLDLSVERILS